MFQARPRERRRTREIDDREEFIRYFTPANEAQPEIHGGFALCHYADDPAVQELLAKLKVTIRCLRSPASPAATPAPASASSPASRAGRAVFAKAY